MKLPNVDSFSERAKALESAYIAEREAELLEALQRKLSAEEAEKVLVSALGVNDHITIKELSGAAAEAQFLAVLAIYPIVAVGWSSGQIEPAELQAILKAADELGIKTGTESYKLLDQWLRVPPDDGAMDLWKNYVTSLCKTLDRVAVAKLEKTILGRATEVAEAAGGFLGLGNKISAAEQECLDGLAKAFVISNTP